MNQNWVGDSSNTWAAPLGRVRRVDQNLDPASDDETNITRLEALRNVPSFYETTDGRRTFLKPSESSLVVGVSRQQHEGVLSTAASMTNVRNPVQLRSRTDTTLYEHTHVVEDIVSAALERYRREPDTGQRYSIGALILGPMQDLPDADLDKFRLALNCHIFKASDNDSLFVCGANSKTVEIVLLGLKEIRSRRIQTLGAEVNALTTTNIVLAKILLARLSDCGRLVKNPVTGNKLISQFQFREHDRIVSFQGGSVPNLPSQSEWQAWSTRMNTIQNGVMKSVVLDRISLLMSTGHGCFLKVRMGICVFRDFIWEPRHAVNIPFSNFVDGLEQDRTDAIISPLNHAPGLLQNALRQNDILSGPSLKPLNTIKPCYEALFEFNSTGTATPKRHLHVTGTYENGRPNVEMIWRKTEVDSSASQTLEVLMCTFKNGLSWKLQIDAAQSAPVLSAEDRVFAASVNLEAFDQDVKPMSPPKLRFDFVKSNNVCNVYQKTIWRAVLRSNSRWLVDIVRFDTFTRHPQGRNGWAPERPRWEVLVHHRKWSLFNSSNITTQDFSARQIKSILLPDDDQVGENGTVEKFCDMMNEISDTLSPPWI